MENIQPIPTTNTQTTNKALLLFIEISIVGIHTNAYYRAFVYFGNQLPAWLMTIGYISSFTDSAVSLYLASKLLVLPGNFNKAIGLSIFFFVVFLIMKLAGVGLLFFSAGLLIIGAALQFIKTAYNASYFQTLLLIVIQTVIVLLISLSIRALIKILEFLF